MDKVGMEILYGVADADDAPAQLSCFDAELLGVRLFLEGKMKSVTEMKVKSKAGTDRIPAGEAALGSDGLFEAVVAYHQGRPSGLSGKTNNKSVVGANNGKDCCMRDNI